MRIFQCLGCLLFLHFALACQDGRQAQSQRGKHVSQEQNHDNGSLEEKSPKPENGTEPPIQAKEPVDYFVKYGFSANHQQTLDRLAALYQKLFYTGNEQQRLFYETAENSGYIWSPDTADIRTEGMSYGMIIAVMMDDQIVFDKLWKFAKEKMQHQSGSRKGYFAWSLQDKPPYQAKDENSAPDGEEYFAMSLFFAAHRWEVKSGIFDYKAEANAILEAMLFREPDSDQVPMFNPEHNMIVFTPKKSDEAFTDPSYHLPAFYQLWAKWAENNKDQWQVIANKSRDFLVSAAHPQTGLYSDYANFDGTPKQTSFHPASHHSYYDSIRTIQNIAMDYLWHQKDTRQLDLVKRILDFYQSENETREGGYVSLYTVDGQALNTFRAEGHRAMNAVGAAIAEGELAKGFIGDLWKTEAPEGPYRYYNDMLYLLGMLHCSGEFRIFEPKLQK